MKDLLPDDRPREKLRHHGPAALGDNELVALVLGSGSRRGNALSVANALLAAHGGLHGLALRRRRPGAHAGSAAPGGADCGGARTGTPDAAPAVGAVPDSAPDRRRGAFDAAVRVARRGAVGIVLLDAKHRVMRTRCWRSGRSTARS
jgi:DNA repair protein RadC